MAIYAQMRYVSFLYSMAHKSIQKDIKYAEYGLCT